jgi:Flp pilus assembly pilin Flp
MDGIGGTKRVTETMKALWTAAVALRPDSRGVTAMEYAIVAAAIVTAIAGALTAMQSGLSSMFATIAAQT